MRDLTLAADWNREQTAKPTAPKRILKLLTRLEQFITTRWQRLEQIAFGLFIGGLVALLVLLYSDILII
jgi:hypothetical protein